MGNAPPALVPLSAREIRTILRLMDTEHHDLVLDLCYAEQLKVILQLADFREHTSDFWSSLGPCGPEGPDPKVQPELMRRSLQRLRRQLHVTDDTHGVAHTSICKVFYTLMEQHQIRFFFQQCLAEPCFAILQSDDEDSELSDADTGPDGRYTSFGLDYSPV